MFSTQRSAVNADTGTDAAPGSRNNALTLTPAPASSASTSDRTAPSTVAHSGRPITRRRVEFSTSEVAFERPLKGGGSMAAATASSQQPGAKCAPQTPNSCRLYQA